MAQGVTNELNGCAAIRHVAHEVATVLQHAANDPRVELIVLDDQHLEAPLRLTIVVDGPTTHARLVGLIRVRGAIGVDVNAAALDLAKMLALTVRR